jgi:hypothetical protein
MDRALLQRSSTNAPFLHIDVPKGQQNAARAIKGDRTGPVGLRQGVTDHLSSFVDRGDVCGAGGQKQ